MAINRSVGQQGRSASPKPSSRASRAKDARAILILNALLEASGRHSGPRPRRRRASAVQPSRPLSRSDRDRAPALPQGAGAGLAGARIEAFERERLYLVRLTSAVGPLPSTPGAAETEASLVAARHALETLAMSERRWLRAWRRDRAGRRLVADPPPARPRRDARRHRIAGAVASRTKLRWSRSSTAARETPASARALAFGGEQLLLQHRACSICSKPAPKPAATIKRAFASSLLLVGGER